MMPTPRCMRLMNLNPALPMIFMCCKLPCAQRRSRIAISIRVGGGSSRGAAAIGGHAHLPAAAAHEGSLDEIMGEDKTAKGLAALELRQAAILGECGYT